MLRDSSAMTRLKIGLCLPGGGVTGAMYQIGALSALEDVMSPVEAKGFDLYIGTSSGAAVATALAGGIEVQRLYRALLDPADNYFPLERSHLIRMDLDEWRRTITTGIRALGHGARSLASRGPTPSSKDLWEQLDRFYDSLPAGLFSLDRFERFLEEFFLRRSVPNSFLAMPKPLRIVAHDLDTGARVLFGGEGLTDVPVARACCASIALPLFYSPVRIRDRHYIDGNTGSVPHADIALAEGVSMLVIVNPMVPVRPEATVGVPTGHGHRASVRDKGLMWVYNQAMRIGAHTRLDDALAKVPKEIPVLLIEPEPTDAVLFMHNPASFAARRTILEYAYKTTRERLSRWMDAHKPTMDRAGWQARV